MKMTIFKHCSSVCGLLTVVSSSETSVNIHRPALCYMIEETHFNLICCRRPK